jgi:hypothetical protein
VLNYSWKASLNRWGRPEFNTTFSIGFGNGWPPPVWKYASILNYFEVLRLSSSISKFLRSFFDIEVQHFDHDSVVPHLDIGVTKISKFL